MLFNSIIDNNKKSIDDLLIDGKCTQRIFDKVKDVIK